MPAVFKRKPHKFRISFWTERCRLALDSVDVECQIFRCYLDICWKFNMWVKSVLIILKLAFCFDWWSAVFCISFTSWLELIELSLVHVIWNGNMSVGSSLMCSKYLLSCRVCGSVNRMYLFLIGVQYWINICPWCWMN